MRAPIYRLARYPCRTLPPTDQNKEVLDAAIREERDFEYDYFGFKTLEKSYLLRWVPLVNASLFA